ncbi:hypothetical protein AU189_10795 [Mycolicibacterium acapulense]|nr:hypothetical protein AU189_10795 [Mycolicibacterium acapulense]
MTNPGEDAARNGPSESDGGASEQTSGGYEAPPIEQSTSEGDQPSVYGSPYQAPPAYDGAPYPAYEGGAP